MNRERWEKIDRMLQAVLEREPRERARFLDEACAGDDALRKEIESLLASNDQVDSFLQSPAIEDAAGLLGHQRVKSMVGLAIGPYTILSQLGVGGMGEVYLALDSRLDRKVALKFLPEDLTDDDRVDRFKREARAASAFNHPNIATIYDIGEAGGAIYIAMEYIEGQTLGARIARQPFEPAEMVEIVTQIANALDEAHTRGITHRDIKSDNIMLTDKGQAKVLDFGLAKVRPGSEDAVSRFAARQTAPGMVMGTFQYMSPEQALGRPLDHRTDIFSLGVVMYEMAAGRLPFGGATPSEMVDQIVHAEPMSIAMARPDFSAPPQLEPMIRKCLEKEPDRRYLTARDLLIDLKNLKRDTAVIEGRSTAAGRHQAPDRRQWLPFALALLILVAGGFALTQLLRGRDEPTKGGQPVVKSIAVLPFKSLASDSVDESIGLGMAETLIMRLSKLRQITVRPLSAVTRYANLEQDVVAAGRELKSQSVLDGSIQTFGDRVRVTVRLVDTKDGRVIWSEQFDEKSADIFKVQDSISERVVKDLAVRVTDEERQRFRKRSTENTEAFEHYIRGRIYLNQSNKASGEKALESFSHAVALDPNYAPAYSGLSDVYSLASDNFLMPSLAMPKAREFAEKALGLDESLDEAHLSMAYVRWWGDWDRQATEAEFKRALELNPSIGTAHLDYGRFLTQQSRFEEALGQITIAQESDPQSVRIRYELGWMYYCARQYDRAINLYGEALSIDMNSAQTHRRMGLAFAQKGLLKEAIAELEKALEIREDASYYSDLGWIYATQRKRNGVHNALAKLQVLTSQKRRYVSPYYEARIYAGLGDKEQVFQLLEKAYKDRSDRLLELSVDPIFDPIRTEPRFLALLSRVGFVP